jgi:hypothetical protein
MKHEKSQYTRPIYFKNERTATTTSTNLLKFDTHTILVVIVFQIAFQKFKDRDI